MGPWSCDVGAYRPAPPSTAAASTRGLRFPAGAGTEIIKAIGATAPPQLSLSGPGGQRVSTRASGRPVIDSRFIVLTDPQSNTTYIAIRHAAGSWRITLAPRTVIRSLLTAATLAHPRITAIVTGRGRARTLHYGIQAARGDQVQFVETAATTHRILGTVTGPGSGAFRFTPGNGLAGRRKIIAIVIRDGMLESQQVLGSYLAPAPAKPALPRHLRVTHHGTTAIVSWSATPGAANGYAVRVIVHDGATRLLTVPVRHTRALINGLLPTDAGTVTVAGIGNNAMPGPAAWATLPRTHP